MGSGAREHAIAEAICRSARKPDLYSFMSSRNPGIAKLSREFFVGKMDDVDSIAAFAGKCGAGLAVIGPELPLEKGVCNTLEETGIKCVGPKKEAARIETDKSFTRNLMEKHRTGGRVAYRVFEDASEAAEYIDSAGRPVVIKPLGLTGGKGVKIVDANADGQLKNLEEAKRYAKQVIEKGIGGQTRVIVEEKMEGEEFSLMAFVDGKHVTGMPVVQDHKFAFENDTGPFTGGMGSISDSSHLLPFMGEGEYRSALNIMKQVVDAMMREGIVYSGILYGGFMLTKEGPKIMEFNARFGDPEAMNILPLLKTDFIDVCEGIVNGRLDRMRIEFEKKSTVCKYVVPNGYPDSPVRGQKVEVGNTGKARIYYASVDKREDGLFLGGSRAIGCVGIAGSITEAERVAEYAAHSIAGPVFHRSDIGTPQLVRKRVEHMKRLKAD